MTWNEAYPNGIQPTLDEIGAYIGSPLWPALHGFIAEAYSLEPKVEYSRCVAAPGWNVKYKKSSRALCSLYPNEGYFTCLVCVGAKEADEAEALLPGCSIYLQKLYAGCKPFNGARWLMVDVTSAEILDDVKKLILTRARPSKS